MTVQLNDKGEFKTKIKMTQLRKGIRLTARDAAGHVVDMNLWPDLKLLTNHVEWARASGSPAGKQRQDREIQAIARRLEEYQFEKTEEYSCGGKTYRIATFTHSGTGLQLNLIPGGSYRMGVADAKAERSHAKKNGVEDKILKKNLGKNATPEHAVIVRPFLIGKREVSQRVWDKLNGVDQRMFQKKNRPIDGVSWDSVMSWLGRAGGGLRLPSEAEWEFAYRAGTKGRYFWADDAKADDFCWHKDNSKSPGPRWVTVHSAATNAFGLSDMAGNISELCEDSYEKDYATGPQDERARRADTRYRVVRGGNWSNPLPLCSASERRYIRRDKPGRGTTGIRVVRTLP
jgi:formylglycine-generating enzyme required for sulfatase activity